MSSVHGLGVFTVIDKKLSSVFTQFLLFIFIPFHCFIHLETPGSSNNVRITGARQLVVALTSRPLAYVPLIQIKDVRTHCYWPSFVRTIFMSQRHVTHQARVLIKKDKHV